MNASTLLDFACTATTLGLCLLSAASCLERKQSHAGPFLAAYFASLSVDSINGLIREGWSGSLSAESVRWLHVANVPVAYLWGPLLYAGIAALISPTFPTNNRRALWHLVPWGAVLAFSVCNALYAFDTSRVGDLVFKITYHAWVLQGLFYLAFAVRRIRHARPLLEQSRADDAVLCLNWLHGLAASNGVIWGLMLIDRVCDVAGVHQGPRLTAMEDILGTLALFALAWSGLHLPRVTWLEPAHAPFEDCPGGGASSYSRSALEAEQCNAIAADLSRMMEKECLYVDSQFDLQTLSRRSGWSSNYVSQAINQGLHQNFFEFVNGFRVSAAERCLTDPADQRTILDIALACGFGSKSTFNAVFKRMTGRTPSELRRARTAVPAESSA